MADNFGKGLWSVTILWYFATTVTVIFIIKLLLTIFAFDSGGDFDVDGFDIHTDIDMDTSVDFDGDMDGNMHFDSDITSDTASDASFVLFTLDSILAFLMVFSWTVLMCINQFELSVAVSVVSGIVLGFLVLVGYSFILSKIKKLETGQVKDVYPEIGQQGTMYLSSTGGKGQAKFSVDGKYIIYTIHTRGEVIPTGKNVVVVSRDNALLIVEELTRD